MKVKLNIARLSLLDRIARCRQIVAAMTGNPNFATPNPPLTQATQALNEAEAAYTAAQTSRQDAKAMTVIQNQRDDFVSGLMNQLAAYVESIAGGDETIIRSAGMDTKAIGSAPTSIPESPDNLGATAGDRDGEIDLSWEAVPGAKSYVIEQSADPPTATSWGHRSVSTRSSQTLDDLTSGARYWFRVAAINGVGQSGWSDPAMKIAP
ncbi:MAG TPA: fibronectin type III domain-containing protein [Pyrinomonadaceae bacterium]|nr:fibronectin type III domain-containing protein [Pyrinomonadaceae bacterium]